MAQDKQTGAARGEYRVYLEDDTVYRLRMRAARESLEAGRVVTWHELLRRAATSMVSEGEQK
jgi:hypothetical protein